jgi:hypothetical protein
MFVLRLGVPLAVTAAVVWWLRRLDARWQAEAEAKSRRALELKAAASGAAPPAAHPARPCWEERNCAESVREHCPAYLQPAVPCWLARRAADGHLPAACVGCDRFTPAPAPVAVRQ